MYARGASVYRQVDLTTATQGQIVARLFARFLADVAAARVAIETRSIHEKAAKLEHARQIVVELRAALDHDKAPELCGRLDALYGFVIEQLFQANVRLTVAPLDTVTKVMEPIGDAFTQIASTP